MLSDAFLVREIIIVCSIQNVQFILYIVISWRWKSDVLFYSASVFSCRSSTSSDKSTKMNAKPRDIKITRHAVLSLNESNLQMSIVIIWRMEFLLIGSITLGRGIALITERRMKSSFEREIIEKLLLLVSSKNSYAHSISRVMLRHV